MSRDNGKSRYERRTKKKKTNVVLNSLIGVVLLLIIIVSASIFLGNDDEKASSKEDQTTENQEGTESDDTEVIEEETNQEDTVDETTTDIEQQEEEEDANSESVQQESEEKVTLDETNSEEDTEEVVTEGGDGPEVIRTIVNPAWEPIGTVQQGEHYNVYDGVDWDEMVSAISYATGLSEDAMTIQFLGNNGHNKSVGTIYTKNKEQIYRVYIEWVDGKGWKPSKVEELSSIEEKKKEENE